MTSTVIPDTVRRGCCVGEIEGGPHTDPEGNFATDEGVINSAVSSIKCEREARIWCFPRNSRLFPGPQKQEGTLC